MSAGDKHSGRLDRDMGLSHADFWRLLPVALGALAWRAQGDAVRIDLDAGWVEITLGEEHERRIALMAIPVTPVTFRWEGITLARFETFLARFDSYYRRGGG